MHGVNLDLLRASATHHLDGRPKDPHSQHRQQLEELAHARRLDGWRGRLSRLCGLFARDAAPLMPCPEKPL